jgi:DNA polymerase-1
VNVILKNTAKDKKFMETTRLLIDGDILIYRICWAVQSEVEWEDGVVTTHVNLEELYHQADKSVTNIIESLNLGKDADVVICLSDRANNFRKKIFSEYKMNRKKNKKPLGYNQLEQYLRDKYQAVFYPTLEADDVIGILATDKTHTLNFVASIDKDMTTIPCIYFNLDTEIKTNINEEMADFNFYLQVLTGDAVDNYKGCPGIGAKKALALLGGHKPADCWKLIVQAYEKVGLTEEDALIQARMARILRSEDYEKGGVKLWNPK